MHWGRAIAIWGVIIVVESIHGVLRTALLTPVIGDLRARQIGVVIGAVLILAIACVLVPWLKARSSRELVAAGLSWVALTVAFEVALGRFVLGSSWDRILADYEPARGGCRDR